MTDLVVTTTVDRSAYPSIVATEPAQREMLVDLALRDRGYAGSAATTHANAYFYLWDRPVGIGMGKAPRRWVQVGFFYKFGGLLFVDDTNPEAEDWAWIAVRPRPIGDAPTVYFDQDSKTQFPPRAVMTLDEVRAVLLEWFSTDKRPNTVDWLAVNSLRWTLDGAGDIET